MSHHSLYYIVSVLDGGCGGCTSFKEEEDRREIIKPDLDLRFKKERRKEEEERRRKEEEKKGERRKEERRPAAAGPGRSNRGITAATGWAKTSNGLARPIAPGPDGRTRGCAITKT